MTSASLPIDTVQIQHLIEEKNFVEAKKIIDAVIDQKLSPAEKGEIYVKIASIYLEITNKLNRQYIEELDNTIDLLKQVNNSEKSSGEELKLAEVKQNLATDSK